MAEAGWLIDRQLGPSAEARFYASIADGDLAVETLTPADWRRVSDLVRDYADLRLGGVDASLVAVAERVGASDIATLDRRHFAVVRPRHVAAFSVLP